LQEIFWRDIALDLGCSDAETAYETRDSEAAKRSQRWRLQSVAIRERHLDFCRRDSALRQDLGGVTKLTRKSGYRPKLLN
jgi:hypothetical protein